MFKKVSDKKKPKEPKKEEKTDGGAENAETQDETKTDQEQAEDFKTDEPGDWDL